jgi:sec-independent protein translocase protein TatC
LAAFILGALLTPTFDMVNSTLVAVPIIVLFEVGLFLSWLARPKEKGYRSMVQKAKAMAKRVWTWLSGG